MGWSWSHRKNSSKNQAQSKAGHKKPNRKRKTFILEEIITPSIALPIADLDAKICPVDGGMIDFPPTNDLPPIFTGEELDIDFLIPDPSPENFDYTLPAIVPDDTELTADLIALDNNTNIEDFINIQDLLDQISNGDLPGFINPIALTGLTAQADIIGAIETLPPPVILPIDPPGSQPNLSSNNNPINDFPSVTQPKNNVAETSDINLSSETLSNLNHDLTQIRELIDHNNSGSLFDTLSSEEAETALERITDVFANNSALVELLAQPDELSKIGFEPANIQVIKDFLNNPEIAESMGLPMLLGEALSNPDSTVLDRFLLNADQAHYLLPINAKQPSVGIIDFAQKQHGKQVKEIFNSINPLVNPRNYTVKNNDWATELVKYVNYLKSQGQTRGIVNLSFDLSQLDDVGVTTRYELTQQELSALQYARDHNVLVVAASGNTGGTMSALGKASQQFDNIITVGAVNQFEAKTDYSAYGNGLTVVAPGGSWQDDPKAFVGTSRSTSYVTAAASLVWASNPDLSWQQVKNLLIETARDLTTPGWDAETGAGLIDIQEAISRAQLTPPQTAPETLQVIAPEFSGSNRVRVLARPASENTEDAIANLIQNQENLGLQWQTLIDLENPDLDLETLKTTVKERINQAFEQYQQVSTDQAIAQVELEQIQDALNLAISHYQIERERLNKLQAQKQQLEANLATLGEEKTALEAETKQLLESIQQEIINVEASLEKAKAKLINPFADSDDNLRLNSELIYQAATAQDTASDNFLNTSKIQTAEAQRFTHLGNSINPVRWQVVGHKSGFCNRSQPVFGWGVDPNLAKQKQQFQWQAGIANHNANALNTLSNAAATEANFLNTYGQFIDTQKDQVANLTGNLDDANKLVEFLTAQIQHQGAVTKQYLQLAMEAEKRRAQNQGNADWHRSLINRWEVVGTKSKGSGKREDVWGWRHYPEHIAPYQQAQHQANLAAQESRTYSNLAQQADAEEKLLNEQLRKLQERLGDWSSLKQGIEYEIAAHELRLQAEQDLLAMHTPVQAQKVETLDLYIEQTQANLDELVAEKLPTQQQLTDATEQRWQETQAKAAIKLNAYDQAQNHLQDFLEFSGFLLPYRERLSALEKQIEQIEAEKFDLEFSIVELNQVLIQSPSETGVEQLKDWANYLEKLDQYLNWAKIQKDQLALAIADSPERLEIAALIKELEQPNAPESLKNKIANLKVLESSGANFLQGFDDLPERLASTQTDLEKNETDLAHLRDEYVNLGLAKADLENQQIPAKEQEIKTTQENIAVTETTLATLQTQLTGLQDAQAQKVVEVANQEAVVATTQAQTQAEIANIQTQINAKDAQIQQQQAVANSYQNQINQARVDANWYEGQRQAHQNYANYWNGQIWQFNEAAYLAYNPDVAKAVAERWWGWQSSGWYHYLLHGRYEGRLPNPHAEAMRNADQNYANYWAQQRDANLVRAQQLTVGLQETQQQINALNQQKAALVQQQQGLQNQLAAQQTTLQQLEQELEVITQETEALQDHIEQQQQKLKELNDLSLQYQQQLADLEAQVPLLDQQLAQKYQEIELTERYLGVIKDEENRLQSRLNLLNQAGIIDQEYTENWQQWQQSYQAQQNLINQLLTTRTASQPDRNLLASLQTELETANQELQKAQTLTETIAEITQNIQFTNLQIGNQQLLLQTSIDRDAPLAAAEQYYYSLAEQHRQRIWYWNGREWAYHAGEAAAYRANLQQASFLADERNKVSQQRYQAQQKIQELQAKLTGQNTQVNDAKQQLIDLVSAAHIQSKVESLNAQITTVKGRLKPFEDQEGQQSQSLTSAIQDNQIWLDELTQTSALQNTALEQLISFGVLASESDVDFFASEVEPQVQGFLEKLEERLETLETQISQNEALQNSYAEKLQETLDPVLQEAQTHLIQQTQAAAIQLQDLKQETEQNIETLTLLVGKANDALLPIRQKQELEIREKLNTNETRLQSLDSLFVTENLADQVIENNTILDYVQLRDQIQQDLIFGVQNWTKLLLDSYQQTKDLGNRHQDLSASVDELITQMDQDLADPQGEYERIKLVLGEGITTLGVLENRADQFELTVDSVEDAIAQIKLRIQQDTELWEEIAPIAIRYGLESEELQEYQTQINSLLTLANPQQKETEIKALRTKFLQENPDNSTAINLLTAVTFEGSNSNQQISQQLNATSADVLLNAVALEGRSPNQALFDKAKAAKANHEAQGHALLAQAAWYQQQAAAHWNLSRKNGPYWYEERTVRGRSGKKRTEIITHVDHHWIVWQQYSQIFPQLRQQAYNHLAESAKWQKEIERIEPLKNQWVAANNAANNAQPSITEAHNLFEQLEAAHESISADKIQLETLENLLPTIQEQLEQAVQEANAQNAKVNEQWEDYDVNSEEYINAVTEILKQRGELNQKSIAMQQEIADAEKWVERQSVALATELENTKTLLIELQNQQQTLTEQLSQTSEQEANEIKTKLVQLEPAVQQLNNKATILTAQQTTLTQKRTLLTAQNEVILAEQRLLDAYLKDPDADNSNLQQQLQDTRTALAEAQRLAEQAEAASQALTAPVQELKQDLLAQNDDHLKQAQAASLLLKDLVAATQANQNYALQVAQKQQQVNDLEFQILQRLQTATAAGYQEAKHLLNVAQYNDMATAAEIYYRDYSDLASDRGGGCSGGGVATANDRILADNYYREMLNGRQLQNQAQAQANAFRHARETAQAQMRTLEIQQQNASEALQILQEELNKASENRATLEQEYAIAQTRLEGITRIREQTEQTFNQLVTLEELNLAQAQLEQEIAKQRQTAIDQAVQERYERDYLELQRKRQETTARLEQLRQLQAEDQFRDSLNQARAQLGLETLESPNNALEISTQMATLLGGLQQLQQQNPEFSDDLKALLNEANADIHAALQGKEAQTIQQNLLNAMSGLIEQIDLYKTEINKIDLEDQLDNQLLQTAQSDLQTASQQLLKELERSGDLQGENEIINPLYLEALNKVALAQQAVDISEDLAKQSKGMLEQIIKQRIEERKLRKKAFWNKILGIVSTVFSLLGTVLTFIPGANLVGLALAAIGGVISVVQSAINGDWMGAIFSAIMTGASFIGGAIGNALKAGQAMVMGMAKAVAQKVLTTIKAFQSLASGAFNGVRNLLSGDKIMGFLQIMGGLAGAATSGISGFVQGGLSGLSDIGKFGYKVLESLSKAPTLIYGGIKAIQSGDWVSGIGNIIKGVISLGKTWTNDFNDGSESPGEKIANILENISSVGIGVSKFITGGLEGLLEGLGDILDGLGDDIQKWVENLVAGGNCDCPCPCPEEELADSAEIIVDEIIDLSPDEMAKRLEGLDPELRLEVMDWLSSELSIQEQVAVVSKLPLEQQAKVIPNLPQETLEEWRDIFLAEVSKKAIEIESQSNISTSLQLTEVINGELQTIGSSSGSNAPTHKEIFGQIVSKSLDGLPSEIGKAFMQMITDPEQLSTLLVSSAEGYVYGGYLAALHLNPATVGFAVGADVVLAGIAITQALKPFYGAWQESGQIVSDAQLTGQIDQNSVEKAAQKLRKQNADFLAENIPTLATGIVGGLSRLPKPQPKPQLSLEVPIPKSPPGYSGGLTSQKPSIPSKLSDWTISTPAKNLINNGTKFSGTRLPTRSGPPNGVLYKVNENQITNYTVYNNNGLPIKRVDLTGRIHNGVPTPHVVEYTHNQNPKTGEIFAQPNSVARPAKPEEIP